MVDNKLRKDKNSCFYCNYLILDGCNSWCELHRAGEVCGDYSFHEERYKTVKKYEKIALIREKENENGYNES